MENESQHDDDTMVDGFVWLDAEISPKSTLDYGIEHRLIAGVAQVYATQPFDTVKVKLQTFPKTFKCMWQCLDLTYRKHGLYRGLYAGTMPAVATSIVENSLLYGTYSYCQRVMADLKGVAGTSNLSLLDDACAGSISAMLSTLVLCPSEVLKCKLQAIQEMKRYVEKGHAVLTPYKLTKRIFQNDGISGFYRGLSAAFVRDIPGYFIHIVSFETARDYFTREGEMKDDIGPWKTMLAGSIGAVVQCTVTFPLDVIKSRIQIQNLNNSLPSVVYEIWRNDGPISFYSGLLPSILRTIPATGALYLVYEHSKTIINDGFKI